LKNDLGVGEYDGGRDEYEEEGRLEGGGGDGSVGRRQKMEGCGKCTLYMEKA